MYYRTTRLDLYGVSQSPAGTKIEKDLEIQGLFFRLVESGYDTLASLSASVKTTMQFPMMLSVPNREFSTAC
ncbi:hypothetical protein [Pseudomonas viridiflava]